VELHWDYKAQRITYISQELINVIRQGEGPFRISGDPTGGALVNPGNRGTLVSEYAGDGAKRRSYFEDQAFRIIEGDTINRIDAEGLMQGEWERLHPNGNFRCRGVYRDGKKEGAWVRKYDNGQWRYQVHFQNGFTAIANGTIPPVC